MPTFTATIYCGFSELHGEGLTRAEKVCALYCQQVGLCVTVTPTKFVYVEGDEFGCAVGLINYPRFPSTPHEIRAKALELARRLKDALRQKRVSVVLSDETVMLQ